MTRLSLILLLSACAAKPVIELDEAAGKTDALVGDPCEADGECDRGEFCDMRVCIPEGPPCPTTGECRAQSRFYDFDWTPIPDNDPAGVERALTVEYPANVASLAVNVRIDHTYQGDLYLTLRSPSGTEVVLRERSGGSTPNLVLNLHVDDFNGEPAEGDWTLHASDHARVDVGGITSWSLDFRYGEPTVPESWTPVEVTIESEHNYSNDMDVVFPLGLWTGGATRARIHFSRLDLETGYDFLEVRDGEGNVLERFTGNLGSFLAGPYDADRLELRLSTDYSVTRYGFAVDRIDVTGAGCLSNVDCGEGNECVAVTCIRHPCFSVCQPAEPAPVCVEGDGRDDGCNRCECVGGAWRCTERACVGEVGDTCGGAASCADGLVCDHFGLEGASMCRAADEGTAIGVCVEEGPHFCRMAYRPVCACTGQTFNNHCERAGLADFASDGRCELAIAIPDADPAGASAHVTVLRPAASTSVKVDVEISHSYRGDLIVTVEAPDGSRHTLSRRQGGSADDFRYSGGIELEGSVTGTWTLRVSDHASRDIGAINFFNVVAEPARSRVGELCGTRGALPCAAGELCSFGSPSCGADDRGGVCIAVPSSCDRTLAPVCGCDGRTYHNACDANAARVSVASLGECADAGAFCGSRGLAHYCAAGEYCHHNEGQICGWADAPGECRLPAEVCTAVYAPVCGCDGLDYSNGCAANAAGVSVQYSGRCTS